MLTIIKGWIEVYKISTQFENQMKLMDSARKDKHKFTIRATEEQMDLLKTCACMGISNSQELNERYINKKA